MRVSIIVPIYNEASTLPGFLANIQTLLKQQPDALELLLVDGGSSDGSERLAAEWGFECLQARRGRALQMNAGAAAASGDVLLFLHADTRLPEGAIERIKDTIDNGASGGYFAVRLDSSRALLRFTGKMISWRSRLTGIASGDQAIFLTRPAFEELDGYASLPLFEDLDLCRRLRKNGRVVPLDAPVITSSRRWERWGIVRTIVQMWGLRLLYYCGVSPERLAKYYGPAR